jgi:HEAT repeat protein
VRDLATTLRLVIDASDLELLRSTVPADRIRAIGAIERVGDARSVELLVACMSDPDVDVLYEAAKALGHIGSDPAVHGLVGVALDQGHAVVRRVVAAFALGLVRGIPEEGVQALHSLVDDPDRWVRQSAREALVRLMRY